jgi:pimeloyl-ACP methyl ester carboxylesterase
MRRRKKSMLLLIFLLIGPWGIFAANQKPQVGTLEGNWKGGYKKGSISGEAGLIPDVEVKPEVWGAYIGEYENGRDNYISIFKFSEQAEDGNMFYFDSETGRVGGLKPLSETAFFSGPSMGSDFPVDIRAEFKKNSSGDVDKLIWKRSGLPDIEARNAKIYIEEKVTYPSGGVQLAGSLRIPNKPGPHPAIVFAHGSGPGTRNQVSILAHFFLHQGIAVLGFDKRGVGQSTGDWRRIDFPDLASDVLAGVKYLQKRTDINPKRIGLYGISQGGWIVSLAASLSEDVAFIVPHSGPGVSPKAQESYMLSNIMTMSGFSKEEIEGVLEALSLLYEYGKIGKGGDKLDAQVNKLGTNPKLADFLPPPSKDISWEAFYGEKKQPIGDPGWFMHLNVDYDPIPAYKKVKCPALVLFGKHDYTVPVEESVAKIEAALKEGGNTSYTIKVLLNAGHGLLEVDSKNPAKMSEPGRFAPGYLDLLAGWLKRILKF